MHGEDTQLGYDRHFSCFNTRHCLLNRKSYCKRVTHSLLNRTSYFLQVVMFVSRIALRLRIYLVVISLLLAIYYIAVFYGKAEGPARNRFTYPQVTVVNPAHRKEFEKARSIALKREHNISGNVNNGTIKVIFQATTFHGLWYLEHYFSPQPGSDPFTRYSCPFSDCRFTSKQEDLSEADAVLFHLRDVQVLNLIIPHNPQQRWILYTMEPPWLEIIDLSKLDGHFNWTMSYRQDSDIVVNYGFIALRNDTTQIRSDTTKIKTNIRTASRPKLAAMVASDCCTESNREEYVEEMQKYAAVEILGSCGDPFCGPAESRHCYKELSANYYFYLSFENALCSDYLSEKFYNVLEHDLVPVVFSGAKNYAPTSSYVDATMFPDPKTLTEHLIAIVANETWYRSFSDWKKDLQAYSHAWQCDLCKKLHTDSSVSVRRGLSKWWLDDAHCQQWNKDDRKFGPVPKSRHQIPCYHTHQYKRKS